MKKLLLFLMPVMLFIIVFIPIKNNLIYWSLYIVLFALFFLFYKLDTTVKQKDLEAFLKGRPYWSIKAGYIKINNKTPDIYNGLLVICDDKLIFVKRGSGKKRVETLIEIDISEISTYTIGRVDDYHEGITFTLNNKEELQFSSKSIKNEEEALNRALKWS